MVSFAVHLLLLLNQKVYLPNAIKYDLKQERKQRSKEEVSVSPDGTVERSAQWMTGSGPGIDHGGIRGFRSS